MSQANLKDKIVIAGGSGFLGAAVVSQFPDSDIVVLTRWAPSIKGNVRYVQWDAKTPGLWTKELEGSRAVINLVGKSVNCRYTEANKKEIISSRVDATLALGKAIAELKNPPEVWINAGSAAIFGNSGDDFKDENSATGSGFSPDVCKAWEKAFYTYDTPKTRKVFLRIGMVLQQKGGILKPFANLVKLGVGGKIGSGKQYMTWIHEADFQKLIQWAIEKPEATGIIHAASPNPVTNSEFMSSMRKTYRVPIGIPNPAFLIKIGAIFIGTEAELVLSGRRVVSTFLQQKGFKFKYPYLHEALEELVNR
ncbi:MAG: TIGR01777 family oxidoreductase [Bacteroidota bacterium]